MSKEDDFGEAMQELLKNEMLLMSKIAIFRNSSEKYFLNSLQLEDCWNR